MSGGGGFRVEMLDAGRLERVVPRVAKRLRAVELELSSPTRACPHAGDAPILFACAHHVDHVGLLCHPCAERHVKGHGTEHEKTCDQCDRVLFDELILAIAINLGRAPGVRLRRGSKVMRFPSRPWVVVGGIGLCNACAEPAEITA